MALFVILMLFHLAFLWLRTAFQAVITFIIINSEFNQRVDVIIC